MKTLVGAVDPGDEWPNGAFDARLRRALDGWPSRAPTNRLDPLEDGELVLGRPLRVFRQWRLSGASLHSLTGAPWPSPAGVADCRRSGNRSMPTWAEHSAPHPDCSCGFYAFYRPDFVPTSAPGRVFGAAEVSGTLICAEFGVRAERMRILAVTAWVDPTPSGASVPVLDLHGLPVYASRDAMLADYPPDPAWAELLGREPAKGRSYYD